MATYFYSVTGIKVCGSIKIIVNDEVFYVFCGVYKKYNIFAAKFLKTSVMN
jgi:hypothetical protein